MKKDNNTTKTIIRHLLFVDNIPRLTYPDWVSLNNSLIFMLKYSILILEQMVWCLHRKQGRKYWSEKWQKLFPLPHFFSLSLCKHWVSFLNLLLQSNLYKTIIYGATQKWLSWAGGCLIKHLYKTMTKQMWSSFTGF